MAVRASGNTPKKLPIKTGHLFIAGAIVMSIITAVLFKSVATDKTPPVIPKIKTEEIVVAADTLPAGTVLMPSDIQLMKWPKDFLPSGAYFTKADDLAGRVLKSDLVAGEPIYKSKLAGDKSIGGLPVLIPDGMRAVTVGVTEIKGVAGFVKPGVHVDVLVTFDQEGANGTHKMQTTRTVLQNIRVLAAAQNMISQEQTEIDKPKALREPANNLSENDSAKNTPENTGTSTDQASQKSDKAMAEERDARQKARKEAEKEAKNVSSVTLALMPDQAEKLALAENLGEIRLVLRPEGDIKEVQVPGVTTVDLLGGPEKMLIPVEDPAPPKQNSAPPPPPPPMNVIEVIEGTTKSTVNF